MTIPMGHHTLTSLRPVLTGASSSPVESEMSSGDDKQCKPSTPGSSWEAVVMVVAVLLVGLVFGGWLLTQP